MNNISSESELIELVNLCWDVADKSKAGPVVLGTQPINPNNPQATCRIINGPASQIFQTLVSCLTPRPTTSVQAEVKEPPESWNSRS